MSMVIGLVYSILSGVKSVTMVVIGDGSFAPQRRKENQVVSNLADHGLLLNGEVSIETISAFALTRNLNPRILLIMYQQAGLISKDENTLENEKFPDIFRSRS